MTETANGRPLIRRGPATLPSMAFGKPRQAPEQAPESAPEQTPETEAAPTPAQAIEPRRIRGSVDDEWA